jgi:hypothetical protein
MYKQILVKVAYVALAVTICASWAYAGVIYHSLQHSF